MSGPNEKMSDEFGTVSIQDGIFSFSKSESPLFLKSVQASRIRNRHITYLPPKRSIKTAKANKINHYQFDTEESIKWVKSKIPRLNISRDILFDYSQVYSLYCFDKESITQDYNEPIDNTSSNVLSSFFSYNDQYLIHPDGENMSHLSLSKLKNRQVHTVSTLEFKMPILQTVSYDLEYCFIRTGSNVNCIEIQGNNSGSFELKKQSTFKIGSFHPTFINFNTKLQSELAISSAKGSLYIWDLQRNDYLSYQTHLDLGPTKFQYLSHPKTLYSPSKSGLILCDLRQDSCQNIYPIESNSCKYEMTFHPYNKNEIAYSTSSSLFLLDTRYLKRPLIEWNDLNPKDSISGMEIVSENEQSSLITWTQKQAEIKVHFYKKSGPIKSFEYPNTQGTTFIKPFWKYKNNYNYYPEAYTVIDSKESMKYETRFPPLIGFSSLMQNQQLFIIQMSSDGAIYQQEFNLSLDKRCALEYFDSESLRNEPLPFKQVPPYSESDIINHQKHDFTSVITYLLNDLSTYKQDKRNKLSNETIQDVAKYMILNESSIETPFNNIFTLWEYYRSMKTLPIIQNKNLTIRNLNRNRNPIFSPNTIHSISDKFNVKSETLFKENEYLDKIYGKSMKELVNQFTFLANDLYMASTIFHPIINRTVGITEESALRVKSEEDWTTEEGTPVESKSRDWVKEEEMIEVKQEEVTLSYLDIEQEIEQFEDIVEVKQEEVTLSHLDIEEVLSEQFEEMIELKEEEVTLSHLDIGADISEQFSSFHITKHPVQLNESTLNILSSWDLSQIEIPEIQIQTKKNYPRRKKDLVKHYEAEKAAMSQQTMNQFLNTINTDTITPIIPSQIIVSQVIASQSQSQPKPNPSKPKARKMGF